MQCKDRRISRQMTRRWRAESRAALKLKRIDDTMKHIMVDLETFGNYGTAAIQQIGWAIFDPHIEKGHYPVLDSGNIFVSVDDCLSRGLTVNESCLQWWLKQSEEARKVACKKGTDLPKALSHLNRHLGQAGRFWCSAPSFDYAILEHAATKTGHKLAWDRRETLCLRTLRRLTPWLKRSDMPSFIEMGSSDCSHVAEYDACKQAVETCVRLRELGR